VISKLEEKIKELQNALFDNKAALNESFHTHNWMVNIFNSLKKIGIEDENIEVEDE